VGVGFGGLLASVGSVGTARHSVASTARGDILLEDAYERISQLETNEALLTEELSSVWFCADGLRIDLNLRQEHHEKRCAEWAAAMELSNFKMQTAVVLIPADKHDVKELLKPISIPPTTKKPRLPASYLMDNTTIRDGLINVSRPLLKKLNEAASEEE
jgi:hypothetical protein